MRPLSARQRKRFPCLDAQEYSDPVRLYRRGKSRIYWVQFHNERKSLGTTDTKAAEAAFRDLQRRHADPTYRPADKTATLGTALKTFEEKQAQRGRAEGTLSMYERHKAHLARVIGEHTPLAQLDAKAVDDYLSTRHKEGAARTTQWKELCTLRGALKLARRHRLYPYALDEVMPEAFEGRESTPGTAHLLMPDVQKLLAALPEPRAAIVAFILGTAADWVSVERAEPGDIDLKAGLAKVRGSKTAHRDRTIPILPPFRALVERAAKALPFSPWGSVRRDLEVACRRAGVAKVTPRDLRRSHARILRAAGVEPSLIGVMLGHRDGRMVERVYGRIEPDELAAVIGARLGQRYKTGTSERAKPTKRSPRSKKSAAA